MSTPVMRIKVDIGPFRRYIRKKAPALLQARQLILRYIADILAPVMSRAIYDSVSPWSRDRDKPHIWNNILIHIFSYGETPYVRIEPDPAAFPYAEYLDRGFGPIAPLYIPYLATYRLRGLTPFEAGWVFIYPFLIGLRGTERYFKLEGRIRRRYRDVYSLFDWWKMFPEYYGRGMRTRVVSRATQPFEGYHYSEKTVQWYRQNWRQLHRRLNKLILDIFFRRR